MCKYFRFDETIKKNTVNSLQTMFDVLYINMYNNNICLYNQLVINALRHRHKYV